MDYITNGEIRHSHAKREINNLHQQGNRSLNGTRKINKGQREEQMVRAFILFIVKENFGIPVKCQAFISGKSNNVDLIFRPRIPLTIPYIKRNLCHSYITFDFEFDFETVSEFLEI